MKRDEVEARASPSIRGNQSKGYILPFVPASKALRELGQQGDEKKLSELPSNDPVGIDAEGKAQTTMI